MRKRLVLTLGAVLAAASALSGAAVPAESGARYVGIFNWTSPDPGFGGFSGIEMSQDGTRFVAISDRSRIVEGEIDRDAKGRITGVRTGPLRPLTSADGKRRLVDAEGLAIAPDGTTWITDENERRIGRAPSVGGPIGWIASPRDFNRLKPNQSVEALAIRDDGALYTMPEDAPHSPTIPVYRYKAGKWDQPFALKKDDGWKPVGADFGPDGRLYLLERMFGNIFGFRSRVRVITLDGERVVSDEELLHTPYRMFDNLEGIAVWRDTTGAIRLTMVSDDNFLPVQSTQLVEYRLTDPVDPRAGLE